MKSAIEQDYGSSTKNNVASTMNCRKSNEKSKKHKFNKNNINIHKQLLNSCVNKNIQENVTVSSTEKIKIKLNKTDKKPKKKMSLHNPTKDHGLLIKEEKSGSNLNELSPRKNCIQQGKLKNNMKLNSSNEEYKPGMLSDSMQIRKYGRVIIPWDPSFGLDESYKVPVIKNENSPKLKTNSLFDLSKRKDITSESFAEKAQLTVFVGNFPSGIKVPEIKKLFRKCGVIHKIKYKTKKVKNHRNHSDVTRPISALITFKEVESFEKALKLNGKLFRDHHLRVVKVEKTNKPETRKSVFVGNLAFQTEDDTLWKAFESCGEIEKVRIIRNEFTGIGKGYGYVNFKTEDAVEKALKLDGMILLERNIRVRPNEFGIVEIPKAIVKRKRSKNKKKFNNTKETENESKKTNDPKDYQENPTIANEPNEFGIVEIPKAIVKRKRSKNKKKFNNTKETENESKKTNDPKDYQENPTIANELKQQNKKHKSKTLDNNGIDLVRENKTTNKAGKKFQSNFELKQQNKKHKSKTLDNNGIDLVRDNKTTNKAGKKFQSNFELKQQNKIHKSKTLDNNGIDQVRENKSTNKTGKKFQSKVSKMPRLLKNKSVNLNDKKC